ncbi:hypothetical protein ACJMK2_007287 [Sinanodonta woodiana]|uniref:Uncharacterized protein n=1 Tax=Sinanodonta woodiana TaxID=1069815 RepID=A0ABD3VI36_SINWO
MMSIHKINVKQENHAQCCGQDHVDNGERIKRIIMVPIAEVKHVPAFVFILDFLMRTWYKGCEKDRPCPRCKTVGHGPRNCKAAAPANNKDSYSSRVVGNVMPNEPIMSPKNRNRKLMQTKRLYKQKTTVSKYLGKRRENHSDDPA